jgi:transcriptional regulator with XRE-family HTH domain
LSGNIKRNIANRPDLKAIGRRIREIRGFDLTQVAFGKLLGIGQGQLSKLELGESAPTLEVLLRIRAISGKSIDWIVTGEEESTR